jgi:hypothetical protein
MTWIHPIREEVAYPSRLKIRGGSMNEIRVFDIDGQPTEFSAIRKEERVQLLFHIKYVWIDTHTNTYGIKINIAQLQKLTPSVFNGPSKFIVPLQNNDDERDGRYATYYRMLKAGITKEAVLHKMRLDGVDASGFGDFSKSTSTTAKPQPSTATKPSPLPPPLPPRNALLAGIAKGITLKSVKNETETGTGTGKPEKPRPPKGAFEAPSLDALLSAKKGLRRVNNNMPIF